MKNKKFLVSVIFTIADAFFAPVVLMLGWNWIIAKGFDIQQIGYWLSFGITAMLFFVLGLAKAKLRFKIADEYEGVPEYIGARLAPFFVSGVMIGIFALVSLGI